MIKIHNWIIQITLILIVIIVPFYYAGYDPHILLIFKITCLFLVLTFLLRYLLSKDFSITKSSLYPILFLLLVLYLISSFNSKTPHKSIDELLKIFSYLLLFFIILNSSNKETGKVLLNFILLSACLVSLYAIYQVLFGFKTIEPVLKEMNLPYPTRVSALFPHPNSLAGFLLMVIPVSLSFLIETRKLIYLVSILLMFISLILTHSYGGFLCLFFSICIYFYFFISENLS